MPHRRVLERVLSYGVATLVFAAPMAIGSVHASVQWVLSAICLVMFAALVLGRPGPVVPRELVLAALLVGIGASAAQLVPLPGPLLGWLSPKGAMLHAEVLAPGSWAPTTLDVPGTVMELVKAFSYVGLFIVVMELTRHRARIRLLRAALGSVGGIVAFIHFVQRYNGTVKIFGLYEPTSLPGSGVFGTFVSGNHAASILALSALVSVAAFFEGEQGDRHWALPSGLLSAMALFTTSSRAGTLAFGAGLFVVVVTLAMRRFGVLRALAGSTVLMGAGLAALLWTAEGLRSRLLPHSMSALWQNEKTRGWRDAMHLIADYPWTGVGRGAFEAPIMAYRSTDEGVRLVYPENILIQLASEWGVPITLVLITLTLLALGQSLKIIRKRPHLGATARGTGAAVFAILLHELFDFGLEMPGVAIPTIVAVALFLSSTRIHRQDPELAPRQWPLRGPGLALAGAWVLVLMAGVWAVPRTLLAEVRHIKRLVRIDDPDAGADIERARQLHPSSDLVELVAARHASRAHPDKVMMHLNRALRLHPANWQGHQFAARLLAGSGRQPQAALEYRMAIERGMPSWFSEISQVVPNHVSDAVPQVAEFLVELASRLTGAAQHEQAYEALTRADAVSGGRESVRIDRGKAALQTAVPEHMASAGEALVDRSPSVAAFDLAMVLFEKAGLSQRADLEAERGIKTYPEAGQLLLTAATIRFDRGDLVGARHQLRIAAKTPLELEQRERMELLNARLAEALGEPTEAVEARSRARMIRRQIEKR